MMQDDFTEEILSAYLKETRSLCAVLTRHPSPTEGLMNAVEKMRNNSRLLGFMPVYSLLSGLLDMYIACSDEKILFTENTARLVCSVAKKIIECCDFIQAHPSKKNSTSKISRETLDNIDIHLQLLYCDKAVTGEMFDAELLDSDKNHNRLKEELLRAKEAQKLTTQKTEEIIKIKSSSMAEIINRQEEMIARTYIISNQIELMKHAISDKNERAMKDTYKLLVNDSQTLQNSLMISHDQFLSLMHDDNFLKSHQEFQGFFVFANGEKYLIPSQFIFDVICANPLEYEMHQNQKYVEYVRENENGTQEEREEIPVYALSSLLPGVHSTDTNALDTILLVDYQSQRIGIIVDSMQKFVSIIKKPMPASFSLFPAFQGVAFDEKYDMIPILYLPEIMKKFRSLRGYDVKKFEAYSQKHINKILVVDDSTTTRQIQHTILSGNGFLVDEAADGIDAMEKIKKKQFDVIVCDDVMPRMNGEIFLENIRRMENYAEVPVVALAEAPLARADAFVSKSDFTREMLIQKIDEVLHE